MDAFAVLSLGSILVVFAIIAIAVHFDDAHEKTHVELPNKLAKKYFAVAAIRNDNNTYSVLTGYVTKKEFETITNYVRSLNKIWILHTVKMFFLSQKLKQLNHILDSQLMV